MYKQLRALAVGGVEERTGSPDEAPFQAGKLCDKNKKQSTNIEIPCISKWLIVWFLVNKTFQSLCINSHENSSVCRWNAAIVGTADRQRSAQQTVSASLSGQHWADKSFKAACWLFWAETSRIHVDQRLNQTRPNRIYIIKASLKGRSRAIAFQILDLIEIWKMNTCYVVSVSIIKSLWIDYDSVRGQISWLSPGLCHNKFPSFVRHKPTKHYYCMNQAFVKNPFFLSVIYIRQVTRKNQ